MVADLRVARFEVIVELGDLSPQSAEWKANEIQLDLRRAVEENGARVRALTHDVRADTESARKAP